MRWQNAETAAEYVDRHASAAFAVAVERTPRNPAKQFFLGLRLKRRSRGRLVGVRAGGASSSCANGLLERDGNRLRLTPRGVHALERSLRGIRMTEALSQIDLRSDTVTKPTPAMRRAMAEAEVGDDVYGEDPTVNRLEERAAAKSWARRPRCLCPPARMGNTIGIKVAHPSRRGSDVR